MYLDSLTCLIEAASPDQLRALALWAFQWLGHQPELTDGPYDGGRDLRLIGRDGAPLPHVVAISIEKDWEKKLRADIAAARRSRAVTALTFVSSRRIPETTFARIEAEFQLEGLQLRKLDGPALASHAIEGGRLPKVLGLFGLERRSSRPDSRPPREELAFTFAFFSPSVASLRQQAQERALELAAFLVGEEGPVDEIAQRAAVLLGGVTDPSDLRPVIDRLRQAGRLLGRNGHVRLEATMRAALAGVLTLRQHEEDQLRDELLRWAADQGATNPTALVDSIWPELGALLLPQVEAMRGRSGQESALRRVRLALEDHSVALRTAEPTLLPIIEAAPLARHLRTGAILRALSFLPPEGLGRALGAPQGLRLVLDSSVVLPTLCCLLHEPIPLRFFAVGLGLVQKARASGVALAVARVWLEEVAAHPLAAWDYGEVAALDRSGLRGSTNTFVSYFAAAPPDPDFDTLDRFLSSFVRLPPRLREADFSRARALAEAQLTGLLRRYDLAVIDTPPSPMQLRAFEERWTWALRDQQRATILVRHDLEVLSWLHDPDRPAGTVVVSWDQVLLDLAEPGRLFDPLAMTELLSLTVQGEAPTDSLSLVAQTVDEAALGRASAVWDELVRIEQGRMRDAAVVQRAHQFKEDYLQRRRGEVDLVDLRRAWEQLRESASGEEQAHRVGATKAP